MQKTDYDIPILNDEDTADLNKYSLEMADALKTQLDKFGNPLSYKGQVETIQDLPSDIESGDIYSVISENKNYIWNGIKWLEYASTINVTELENEINENKTNTAEAIERIELLENKKIEITTDVEYATNEFIDGKQVFRKRINLGYLPNTTSKEVNTGLSNVNIIKYDGIVYDVDHNTTMPIPYVASYLAGQIGFYTTNYGATIKITAGDNRSTWLGSVELYYTKK